MFEAKKKNITTKKSRGLVLACCISVLVFLGAIIFREAESKNVRVTHHNTLRIGNSTANRPHRNTYLKMDAQKIAALSNFVRQARRDRTSGDQDATSAGPTEEERIAGEILTNQIESLTDDQLEQINKEKEIIMRTYWQDAPGILTEMLNGQEKDDDWTKQVRETGEEFLFSSEYRGTTLVSADCRETLCEVLLHHQHAEDAERFRYKGGAEQGPWFGEQFGKAFDRDDTFITRLVFSKDRNIEPFRKIGDIILERSRTRVSTNEVSP